MVVEGEAEPEGISISREANLWRMSSILVAVIF